MCMFTHAKAENIYISGDRAEKTFRAFLELYSEKCLNQTLASIPDQGNRKRLLQGMIFIHAQKSINPNGIDRLLMNYNQNQYRYQWKKVFICMLSKISVLDRTEIQSLTIATNARSEIVGMIVQSNDEGEHMILNHRDFKGISIAYPSLMNNKSGERN